MAVGEAPVSVPFLDRSEAANTPKATAVGLAMFDIGVALVFLLETGLVHPPVYGLGGGMGPLVVGIVISCLLREDMVVTSIRQAGSLKPQVRVQELRVGQAEMPPIK